MPPRPDVGAGRTTATNEDQDVEDRQGNAASGPEETPVYDVIVVGAGPAGLHAAFKAAALYRTVVVFDGGREFSRIHWVPRVANIPGRYGVSGQDIITSAMAAIKQYEEEVGRTFVTFHREAPALSARRLGEAAGEGGTRDEAGQGRRPGKARFEVVGRRDGDGEVRVHGRNFILATGAMDRQPRLSEFRRRDIDAILPYANKGLADYCLLCDGHTVEGQRVAVLGCDPGSRTIAKSLKANFGADTVLVPYCNPGPGGEVEGSGGASDDDGPGQVERAEVERAGMERAEGERGPEGSGGTTHGKGGPTDPGASWQEVEEDLAKWDIPILYGGIKDFSGIREGRFGIVFDDGRKEMFDKAWISMGWYEVRSGLAEALGAALDDDGFVRADDDGCMLDDTGHAIPGAYAIGDVRSGTWKQIPIAWGQAEAAVIHAFMHTRRVEPLEPRQGAQDVNVVTTRENRDAPLADR